MPDFEPPTPPMYSAGDVLVSPSASADGAYDVARVSANGRSTHTMGVQTSQLAALRMAARATSGLQRVFLQSDTPGDFRPVAESPARGQS
jgi:hypothetical protein